MQQCIQPTGTNRPRAWRPLSLVLALERSGAAVTQPQVRRRPRRAGTPAERTVSGGHSGGETPVPIPNTAVKPARADGTWGEAPWESRSPPGFRMTTTPSELRLEGVSSFPGAGIGRIGRSRPFQALTRPHALTRPQRSEERASSST